MALEIEPATVIGPIVSILGTGAGLAVVQAWASRNKDRMVNDSAIRAQLLERITKLEKDGADRERELELRIETMEARHRHELKEIRDQVGEYIAKNIRLNAEHEALKTAHEALKAAHQRISVELARLTGRMDASVTPTHLEQTAENNRILSDLGEKEPEL